MKYIIGENGFSSKSKVESKAREILNKDELVKAEKSGRKNLYWK